MSVSDIELKVYAKDISFHNFEYNDSDQEMGLPIGLIELDADLLEEYKDKLTRKPKNSIINFSDKSRGEL